MEQASNVLSSLMGPRKVTFSSHHVEVEGQAVELRVFVPAKSDAQSRPAVVMACGLFWLGNGWLGKCGLAFNDQFGYSFARSGCSCVQIHTPARHQAHTRLNEMVVLCLAPFMVVPGLRFLLLAADIFLLAMTPAQHCFLAFILVLSVLDWVMSLPLVIFGPLLSLITIPFFLFGFLVVPGLHILFRLMQWVESSIPAPKPRNYISEMAAAVAWTQKQSTFLGSDGRMVLCGYSSGGHVAAMYGLSKEAPQFDAVVLISGIFDLRTDSWTGLKSWLAPVFNTLYRDILCIADEEGRMATSPLVIAEAKSGRDLKGVDWYVLNARMELMGMQPFQDILFSSSQFCVALRAKGAKVSPVTCGLNHWFLVWNIGNFVQPFCERLAR